MRTLFTTLGTPAVRRTLLFAALLFASGTFAAALQAPSEPPDELVRKTVANELKQGPDNYMFRSRKQAPWGSQTHIYVQTKDAIAGILVAENDQPIDAQKRQA